MSTHDALPTTTSRGWSRRRFLRRLAVTGGTLGLASAATGLPRSFLLGHSAAQSEGEPTYLILSSASAGHPINTSLPGLYPEVAGDTDDPLIGVDHPRVAELGMGAFGEIDGVPYGAAAFETPEDVTFGTTTRKAAGVWNALPADLRGRMTVLHHPTLANAHPEFANVLRFHGAISGLNGVRQEMLASMIAQENAAALDTLLDQPVNVGSNLLTFGGQPLGTFDPTDLQSLFGGGSHPTGVSDVSELARLRTALLDDLYADVRESGVAAQRVFLDRYSMSQDQARSLGDSLAPLLEGVTGDSPINEVRTAVALLRLNVTPVVVMQLQSGGDNHQDSDLAGEVTQTIDSVNALRELWTLLTEAGLQDRVTFGYLDVFGRTLFRNDAGGRNHNRDHHAMLMFGPRMAGGVLGGVVPTFRGNGSQRDFGSAPLADVPFDEGLAAAGKTLAAACGVPAARIEERIVGGRVLDEALLEG